MFNIYEQLNRTKSYFTKKHKYTIQSNKKDTAVFSFIYNIDFVSRAIIQYYELECDIIYTIKSNNIKLYITCTKETSINPYVQNILAITNWLINGFNVPKNKKINIFVMLCPLKKTFDLKKIDLNRYPYLAWTHEIDDNALSPLHINSGVSWGNNIFVYRTEDFYKVLLHELIHNFHLDLHEYEKKLHNNITFYVGNTSILINEAYTEYLALIFVNFINLLCLNQLTENNFAKAIQNELIHQHKLCKKLFKYYEIKDKSLFLHKNKLKQSTNAFSYIYIKYIIMKQLPFDIINKDIAALNINKIIYNDLLLSDRLL